MGKEQGPFDEDDPVMSSIHYVVLAYLMFAWLGFVVLVILYARRRSQCSQLRRNSTTTTVLGLDTPHHVVQTTTNRGSRASRTSENLHTPLLAQQYTSTSSPSTTGNSTALEHHTQTPPTQQQQQQQQPQQHSPPPTTAAPLSGDIDTPQQPQQEPTHPNTPQYIEVRLPPHDGPLGLRFNLTTPLQVRQTVLLPDGTPGPLEGQVPPGAILAAIDGDDASRMSLPEFKARLDRTKHSWRLLVFRIIPTHNGNNAIQSGVGAIVANSAVIAERLQIRENMARISQKLGDMALRNVVSQAEDDVSPHRDSVASSAASVSVGAKKTRRASDLAPQVEYKLIEVTVPPGPLGARMAHTTPLQIREILARDPSSTTLPPLVQQGIRVGATLYQFEGQNATNMSMSEFKSKMSDPNRGHVVLVFKTPVDDGSLLRDAMDCIGESSKDKVNKRNSTAAENEAQPNGTEDAASETSTFARPQSGNSVLVEGGSVATSRANSVASAAQFPPAILPPLTMTSQPQPEPQSQSQVQPQSQSHLQAPQQKPIAPPNEAADSFFVVPINGLATSQPPQPMAGPPTTSNAPPNTNQNTDSHSLPLPLHCFTHVLWCADDIHPPFFCLCSGSVPLPIRALFPTPSLSLFDTTWNLPPCVPPPLAPLITLSEFQNIRSAIRSFNAVVGLLHAVVGLVCFCGQFAFALWWETQHQRKEHECSAHDNVVACYDVLFLAVVCGAHVGFIFVCVLVRFVLSSGLGVELNVMLAPHNLRVKLTKKYLRFERV